MFESSLLRFLKICWLLIGFTGRGKLKILYSHCIQSWIVGFETGLRPSGHNWNGSFWNNEWGYLCWERLAQPSTSWDLSGRNCSWKERRETQGCCQQPSLLLHPALPQPLTLILMAPLENLNQSVPISLPQAPASCCPSQPRAYFRPSKLEDTSATIEATSSLRGEDTGPREVVGSWLLLLRCHLRRSRHLSEPFGLRFISSAVGFVCFSPREAQKPLAGTVLWHQTWKGLGDRLM